MTNPQMLYNKQGVSFEIRELVTTDKKLVCPYLKVCPLTSRQMQWAYLYL